MKDKVDSIVKELSKIYRQLDKPYVSELPDKQNNPFKVLISCILSLRTKDEVTKKATERLFERVKTIEDIIEMPEEEIAKIIYPVGFYRNKAKTIKAIAKELLEKYGGKVPDTVEELLKLKGVGRKTANLVITEAYGKDGVCVDTHVHRISNRMGLVSTKTPYETEVKLKEVIPKKYWKIINKLLVAFGKTICKPVAPICSRCPFDKECPKVNVAKSR